MPFYFSAETTGAETAVSPSGAPDNTYHTISAITTQVLFSDDFETDTGWTLLGDAADGAWERGTPIPLSTCDRGNPGTDADGSGQCYLTDNSADNDCDSDVDSGLTIIMSPILDDGAADGRNRRRQPVGEIERQYVAASCSTCGLEEHDCGNLLAGCVWSTRNELEITEPTDFLDIISSLSVNSIFLHTGTGINPLITIDFLTLDDDDAEILNGTPHYDEINAGFSAHESRWRSNSP